MTRIAKLLAAKPHYTRLPRTGKLDAAETGTGAGALSLIDAAAESRYF
jgi:hypothetical protein